MSCPAQSGLEGDRPEGHAVSLQTHEEPQPRLTYFSEEQCIGIIATQVKSIFQFESPLQLRTGSLKTPLLKINKEIINSHIGKTSV